MKDSKIPTDEQLEKIAESFVECSECFEPMTFVGHHFPIRVSLFDCKNCGESTELDWDYPEELV